MRSLLISFTLCSIIACQSKQSGTNNNRFIFNKNEKPYVVTEIKPYTDSTGKQWHEIIMKGPNKETYSSYAYESDTLSKIGDTVMIGHSQGKDYIVRFNKQRIKFEQMPR